MLGIGFNFMYTTSQFLNFAYGSIYTLVAYLAYYFLRISIGVWFSYLLAMTIGVLLSILIYHFAQPQRIGSLRSAAFTIASALLIEGIVEEFFGENYYSFPLKSYLAGYNRILYHTIGVPVQNQALLAASLSSATLLGVWFLLYRTKLGYGFRALALDESQAELVGVNAKLMGFISAAVGGSLVSEASLLLSPSGVLYPDMGWVPLIEAFGVVIVGGLGSLRGTVIAALGVSLVYEVVFYLVSPVYSALVPLALAALTIALRPNGLYGRLK